MSNRYDWHRWFAWFPVRLSYEIEEGSGQYSYAYSGNWAWLRYVECRIRGAVAPNGDLTDYWDYRNPQPATEVQPWADKLSGKLDLILNNQETIMIDTTRILAAVAKERTENASLRALVDAQTKIMTDTAAALKAAMDAGSDPAALAKVQADLDQAATDLDTDNDATYAAIKANTPAAAAGA